MQNYEVMYHKIIAKNLREIRKENKLSQEKFAEIVGCSREFISRAENFKERLELKMIFKISFIFKFPPERFFKKWKAYAAKKTQMQYPAKIQRGLKAN